MKYRIVRVSDGGYEIEQKMLFFWVNLNHGFVCRVPYKNIEEAEDVINNLVKKKIVVKEIDFKSKEEEQWKHRKHK